MDKMREEFEGWVRRRGGDVMKRDRDYISSITREWWQAWQASRQALVVQLPATCCRTLVFEIEGTNEVGMEHDEYYEVDDIINVLSSAGIKCT